MASDNGPSNEGKQADAGKQATDAVEQHVTFPPRRGSQGVLRILVLTRYSRLGASSRMRFLQFIEAFASRSVNTPRFTVSPLLDDVYIHQLYASGSRWSWHLAKRYLARLRLLVGARAYDGIWVEKELFPGLPAWGERLAARLGVRMVVDFDDATFVFYKNQAHPVIRYLIGNKIEEVCRSATVVTTGNSYLSEFAVDAGAADVVTIPTVIDTDRYETHDTGEVASATQDPRPAREQLTIGWIGSPSTAPYLLLYAEALVQAQARYGARIVTIGAPAFEIPGVQLEAHPWSEETESRLLAACHIALAPLAQGMFERGKCSFKVIQCMAARLPVIGSPVGVNAQIIAHGSNGYLAASPSEALAAIDALATDPHLRRRIGLAGRRTVDQSYSLVSGKPSIAAVLSRAFT